MFSNAETESLKQEIFDLLLVAGYFRIRIPSLSDFDKMLGGISWGIVCSGFDIDLDLEYSDEFRIKEKIKLAERVVKGLKKMNCPHPLLPHQIQGLDYGAIYPVVKWLLQFVIETRQQRQAENTAISSEIGRKITSPQVNGYQPPVLPLSKPSTRNKNISTFALIDSIRVYSALAEYGDREAASVYHRMIIGRKQVDAKVGRPAGKTASHELTPGKDVDNQDIDINDLDGFVERPRLARRNSISAEDFMELLEENKDENEKVVEKIKAIEERAAESGGIFAQETALFNEQKQAAAAETEKAQSKIEAYTSSLHETESLYAKVNAQVAKLQKEADDLSGALNSITATITQRQSMMKASDINALESLVQKQIVLKEKRGELKKNAKEEKKKIEAETAKIEGRLDEINGHEDIIEINDLYEDRKTVYSAKQAELAEVSKESALLMRKIQEYPNNIEISQYTKRYVDLVEKIAKELESQKQLDSMNNGRIDIERMSTDHSNLLKNLKTNMLEIKKDKQRLDLASNIEEVNKAVAQNLDRSKTAYKRSQAENESLLTELDRQLTLQRDYYQLLQKIQLEFEK
jgi:CCDC93, coiled-coil domain